MVFEGEEEDWKDFLARDAKAVLMDLLDSTKDHRGAFYRADDVKVAQVWTALVELKKEIEMMKNAMERVGMPFKSISELGEVEKRVAIEKLVRDIVKPEPEQEAATQKLIDSLMRF